MNKDDPFVGIECHVETCEKDRHKIRKREWLKNENIWELVIREKSRDEAAK